jgi:hypothetical protein
VGDWFEEEAAKEEQRRQKERDDSARRGQALVNVRQAGPLLLARIRDHAKSLADRFSHRFGEPTDRLTFMSEDDGFTLSRSGKPSVNMSVRSNWKTGTVTVTYHRKAAVFDEPTSAEEVYALGGDSPEAVHILSPKGTAWDLATFCHHILAPVLFPHAEPPTDLPGS